MWEIRKRQAVIAFTKFCTLVVLCVLIMLLSALFVSLIPQSVASKIYSRFRYTAESNTESSKTESSDTDKYDEITTIIDHTWQPVILKDDTSYEGDAIFVSSVNLSRYTKSQKPAIFIINQTKYTINTDNCLETDIPAGSIFSDKPTVLIYHTHGTEGYASGETYKAGDNFRTENINENVVAVGKALTEELERLGIRVIHDTEMYDREDYSLSYSKSKKAVKAWLAMYPSIRYCIDIRRDSVVMSEKQVKLISEINGKNAAQIMLVVGTDEGGSSHGGWLDNFTAAVHLQNKINEMYPTLARPIYLRTASFNQDLSPGALLIEFGSSGNTLEEAIEAAKLTAEAMAEALK